MSKIEVNTIEPQCGTTVTVGKCTSTIAVPGNVVKSNAVQASDGGNIVSQSGTDITLGASGDTINLASGASQSGFGRTGTVDWITTPKVTGDSPVTGVTGKGYFLNTTAGTITLNLPAGAAGSIVSVADYAATWQTNNVTVAPNGSEKIGSVNASVTLNTEGQSVTLVYVDSTQGWINTMDSTSNVRGVAFITATGGTPSQSGDYEIRTFTGPGTFCVSSLATCSADNAVDWLVVAGGGGGGGEYGAGGGAGGYRESPGTATGSYTVSPLGAAPSAAVTVTASPYSIVVGGGGAGKAGCVPGATPMDPGSASSFSIYPSAGGGAGRWDNGACAVGDGGSGGGGGGNVPAPSGPTSAGTGNTPPVSPPQGTDGGHGKTCAPKYGRGGGGGALVAGSAGGPTSGGNGGGGATSSIDGTPTARAGGGGGSTYCAPATAGTGGAGGGGAGSGGSAIGTAGGVNTGGGGGGAAYMVPGGPCGSGAGGSGVVILRYKFQ